MSATHDVTCCRECPFVEKEVWSNEDESGTDYNDCALGGMPEPYYKNRGDLYGRFPPSWCKLRESPVLVRLVTS